jgi:CheY-like chemotaxis protein
MRVAHQNSSKILVVEDDAVTRELLVQLLRMAGFDVRSAATGEEALVLLRKHRQEIH